MTRVWVTLVCALACCAAHAADTLHTEFHGNLESDSQAYAETIGPTNEFLQTERLTLDSTTKYGRAWKLKVDPLLQADPLNNSISERYWIDLPEGYLQSQSSLGTLQLGYNTFSWGVTDGFNPLDVVSARRYQDPLTPDKLGAPSVSFKKDVGTLSFEGLYIPYQRSSVLPADNSRWLPRQVLTTTSVGNGDQAATLFLPPNLQYFFEPSEERNSALENNFGGRIQAQGILPGLDASIEGFEGSAPTPAIDDSVSGTAIQVPPLPEEVQVNPLVLLTPVYYRQRVYGGTLVYANFGMIFRCETAITRVISKGSDLPGSAEEYVCGVERPFPVAGNDLTILAQGTYAHHTDPLTNSTTSLNRIFDHAAILGARYSFSEKLSALLTGLYDAESDGEFVHAEMSYSLTDGLKLGLATDGMWGAPNTPLGSYSKNDRIIASVKIVF